MGDLEHALSAYEHALRHNPMSLSGLTQVAGIARIKENYPKVGVSPVIFQAPLQTILAEHLPSLRGYSVVVLFLILSIRSLNDVISIFRRSISSNVFLLCKKRTAKYGVHWVCPLPPDQGPVLILSLKDTVISCRMTFRRHTLPINKLYTFFQIQRCIVF